MSVCELALVLACLVCTHYGWRFQTSVRQKDSLDALAMLILHFNPSAGFHPSGPVMRVAVSTPAVDGLQPFINPASAHALLQQGASFSTVSLIPSPGAKTSESKKRNTAAEMSEISTARTEVESRLLLGDGSGLDAVIEKIAPGAGSSLDALVVLSLGADHQKVLAAVQGLNCPVYFSETYGILGYDEEKGQNVELLEKDRGQEYGCRGGDGGQGCVVIAYSGGGAKVAHESFPEGVSSMMVVADGSGAFQKLGPPPAVIYGGITKEAYVLDDGAFKPIPYFFVGTMPSGGPVGVSAFTGDAGDATADLVAKLPAGHSNSKSVALFPCYTRGINEYGENDVEPRAISAKLPGSRIFGMFAHGELGPSSFAGFSPPAEAAQSCTQHSATSILAMYTVLE